MLPTKPDFRPDRPQSKSGFFGVPLLATYISFFSLLIKPGLGGTGIDPGMTFISFPSSVVEDEFRTHDHTIVSLVCYPLDRTFALTIIVS